MISEFKFFKRASLTYMLQKLNAERSMTTELSKTVKTLMSSSHNSDYAIEDVSSQNNAIITEYLNERSEHLPELAEISNFSSDLQEIVLLISNVLNSSKDNFVPSENVFEIERGFRFIVGKLMAKNTGNSSNYMHLLSNRISSDNAIKFHISDLQRKLQDLEFHLRLSSEENREVNVKLDSAFKENVELKQRIMNMENKHKEKIDLLQREKMVLDDKYHQSKDISKRCNERIAFLEREVAYSHERIESLTNKVEDLKDSLNKKREVINKLNASLANERARFEQLNFAKLESEKAASSEHITQPKVTDDNNRVSFNKLLREYKEQALHLSRVTDANRKAAETIIRQQQILDEFESEVQCVIEENSDLKGELEDVRAAHKEVSSEMDKVKILLENRTEELTELRNIVSDCLETLAPTYATTLNRLPETVRLLASKRTDPQTLSVLEKYSSYLGGLTLFVTQLLRGEKPDIKLLRDRNAFISIDHNLRLDILSELSRIRHFCETNLYPSNSDNNVINYLLDFKEEDIPNTPDINIAVVLSYCCARLRRFAENQIEELSHVRDVLPSVDCSPEELSSAVAQYLLELKPVFNQFIEITGKTLKYHGSTNDIFACLCKYVEETSVVMTELEEKVRPIVGYSGKIANLPAFLVQVFNSEKERPANVTNRDLTDSLVQADKEKSAFIRKIDELQDSIKMKENINNNLRAEIQKINEQLLVFRGENKKLYDKNTENERLICELYMIKDNLEHKNNYLVDEEEKLRDIMEKRKNSYEDRLNQTIEDQRKLREDEKSRLEKRYTEQLEVYKEQLERTSEKYLDEKNKNQDLVNMYNEAQKQTQIVRQELESRRIELENELEKARKSPELKKRVKYLENQLSEAKYKNKQLIEEKNRISSMNNYGSLKLGSCTGSHSIMDSSSYNCNTSLSSSNTSLRGNYTNTAIGSQKMHTPARARAELDQFITNLGTELNEYFNEVQDYSWSKSRVLMAISAMVRKLKEVEAISPDSIRSNSALLRSAQNNSDWIEWADEMLKSTYRHYTIDMSEDEKRARIEDLLNSSIGGDRLINIISNLRDQKKLLSSLVPHDGTTPRNQEPKMKSLLSSILFVSILVNYVKSSRNRPRFVTARQTSKKNLITTLTYHL